MLSSKSKFTIQRNIPVLSITQEKEIMAYYVVFEKYADVLTKKLTEDLQNHPVFGKLIKGMPKEVLEAQNKVSRELQEDAIINGNWQPYIEYQAKQGREYAKLGLEFKAWFELVGMVKDYLRPYLYQEYRNGTALLSALSGMNRFMDIAMSTIGEAYIEEKNAIIKERQDLFSSIVNSSEDAILSKTLDGEITSWNPGAEEVFGYSAAEIIGKNISVLIPPNLRDEEKKIIEKIRNGKYVNHYETERVRKDGKTIRVSLTISPIKDSCGNVIGASNISRDITERIKLEEEEKRTLELTIANKILARENDEKEKRAAELALANRELKQAQARLESVNKELEAYSYSISHDLRTPLRGISGYAQILWEDYGNKLDGEAGRIISNIRKNTEKMEQLINDILAYSRLGQKELKMHKINMQDTVNDIWEELVHEQAHRNIELRISELLPAKADNTTIRQVWVNLISNAIKYSKLREKAIIEINSEIKGKEVIYCVKDNGAGFDMRYANKLFGIFQRLHSNEEFQGTGVGLAIVQRIISKHGGRVWAESKVNEGASFYFTLNKS